MVSSVAAAASVEGGAAFVSRGGDTISISCGLTTTAATAKVAASVGGFCCCGLCCDDDSAVAAVLHFERHRDHVLVVVILGEANASQLSKAGL